MKPLVIFALTFWPLLVLAKSPVAECPVRVVPGASFGPLRLGQTLAEVKRLGLIAEPVAGAPTQLRVGSFVVGLTEKKTVRHIEAELGALPKCVWYAKSQLKQSMTVSALAKIFPKCDHPEAQIGGESVSCQGVVITSGGWGGQQATPQLKVVAQ